MWRWERWWPIICEVLCMHCIMCIYIHVYLHSNTRVRQLQYLEMWMWEGWWGAIWADVTFHPGGRWEPWIVHNNYDSSARGESMLIPLIMISIDNWSKHVFFSQAAVFYQLCTSHHRPYHCDYFSNEKLIIGRIIINPDSRTFLIWGYHRNYRASIDALSFG